MFHISVLLFDTNVVFLFGERHHGGVLFMVTVVWLASSFPWIRMWSLLTIILLAIGIVVPLFNQTLIWSSHMGREDVKDSVSNWFHCLTQKPI